MIKATVILSLAISPKQDRMTDMAIVDSHASFPSFVIPPAAVTLDGFRSWVASSTYPETGRITFVSGGLIVDMSPERYESHLKIKAELNRVIHELVLSRDLGEYYPDGGFFTHREASISCEPDAMFASWQTLESGRLTPPQDQQVDGKYAELVGTPDWICEIVSDSSVEKDTVILREAYHKAGVAEYWLIDGREEDIRFQILEWQPQGYVEVAPYEQWTKSKLFDCHFSLARSKNRVGTWSYRLSVKS